MANKATADSVAADIRPPEYRKAVQLMRHELKNKKERIARITEEMGDTWGKIEGFRVNKAAGKLFIKLDNMEHEERVEVMRCLNGLIDVAEWPETEQDLVDGAEGKVVPMRVGGKADDSGDDGDDGGDDDDTGDQDRDPPPAKTREEALERSRARLSGAGAEARKAH